MPVFALNDDRERATQVVEAEIRTAIEKTSSTASCLDVREWCISQTTVVILRSS